VFYELPTSNSLLLHHADKFTVGRLTYLPTPTKPKSAPTLNATPLLLRRIRELKQVLAIFVHFHGFSEERSFQFISFFCWVAEPLFSCQLMSQASSHTMLMEGRQMLERDNRVRTDSFIGSPLKKSGTTTKISSAFANASAPCSVCDAGPKIS
jgi:hypothetical protein